MTSRTRLKRKEIDDVLGGDEMWKHADQTQGKHERVFGMDTRSLTPLPPASCDKCNFNAAYFYQLQIRSADEPMTTCKSLRSKFSVLQYLTYRPWLQSIGGYCPRRLCCASDTGLLQLRPMCSPMA